MFILFSVMDELLKFLEERGVDAESRQRLKEDAVSCTDHVFEVQEKFVMCSHSLFGNKENNTL